MLSKLEDGVISINRNLDEQVMQKAIARARETMNQDLGGPFGAAVIGPEGTVLSVASNSVLADADPSAHAEINAIRQAGKALGTHDMSGCTLYTTAYPCPMCLGATIWANIKHVIYGCRPEDADAIGFRDDFIYEFFKKDQKDESILVTKEAYREECLELFKEYKEKNKQLY